MKELVLFFQFLFISSVWGLGEIRADCPVHTRLADDFLVFPREPGVSHMHDFYGAKDIDAFSSPQISRNSETSCTPDLDHSAYWTPSIIYNGQYISAERVTVYYHAFENHAQVQTMPLGLTIIARTYSWSCLNSGGNFNVASFPIPDCGANGKLEMYINFPQCNNGSLDSSDHISHMAYAQNSICPSSHPILMPRLQLKIRFPIRGGPGTSLSSGTGNSAHADFVNGWEPEALMNRVVYCLRGDRKCEAHLAGDDNIVRTLGNVSITGAAPPIDTPPDTLPPVDPEDEPTSPQTPTARPEGTLVIIPFADSYVRGGTFGTENYGDQGELLVKKATDPSFQRESFISWDISTIEKKIVDCKLEVTVNEQLTAPADFNFKVGLVEGSFLENSISFNNKPSSTFLKTVVRPQNATVISIDVLDICQNAQLGSKQLTLRLYLDDGELTVIPLYLHSREAGFNLAPKLVIMTGNEDLLSSATPLIHFTLLSFIASFILTFLL